MGKGGGRKLIAGAVAWAAVAALAVVGSASPVAAAPSRSPIRYWGPNVSYTGDAGAAKKIHAIEKLGNVLYVGGNFDTIAPEPATTNNNGVAGVAQPHLYAVDATTGAYLPQFAPQLNGPVFALEIDATTGTLYVGGTFTTVNGESVTGLAALDTTTGVLKGTQRSLFNTGGAPGAYALHLVGRQLYVGGQFTNVGGVAKGQIAKLSVDAANQVDPAFQSYLREGKVLSLSNDGTKLIVAGEFDALQTGPGGTDVAGTRFLGAVALDTGTTVATFVPNVPCPGTCNAETRGRSVTIANGIVFAAFGGNWGRFGAFRSTDGAQLSMWDVSGDAQAVATSGNTVFVGGHFDAITNLPGDPARCHAFSATFGTVDAINLQLQSEPNIYNGGHLGVFSIVAPAADDTYWAGDLTRFDQPPTGDACGRGSQTVSYSHIMRMVEGGGPADAAVPSTPSNVVRTDGSTGSIDVSWTASTDDTAVTAYYVFVNGVARKTVPGSATSVTLTAADVPPAVLANPGAVRVQALDPFGKFSAKSAIAAAPPPTGPTPTPAGEFTPTPEPYRILDTRDGTGGPRLPLRGGQPRTLNVLGQGGVPTTGVAMVAMNVTVTNPSAGAHLTVFPYGGTVPNASNLNFVAGQTVPNLVLARVGTGGGVDFSINNGTADVIADVVGWVADATASTPGSRTEPLTPNRVLDTRTGLGRPAPGPVGPGQAIEVQVLPPNQGYTGVVLNLTGVTPTASTFVTAYPGNVASPPKASNLNLVPGDIRPNLVMVGVSPQGTVKLYNLAGRVDLVVDVVGRFTRSNGLDSSTTGRIVAINTPERLVDTRTTHTAIGAGATHVLDLARVNAYAPAGAGVRGIITNATATQATTGSYLTLYPNTAGRPNASNLNITPNRDVPNLALATLGSDNRLAVFNLAGSVHYVLDATAVVLG